MKFREYLNEVMLTFDKHTHPKFGEVIILAGGAGSGKGFIKSNIIGVEGIVFNVDRLKELAIHSTVLADKVKEKYGKSIKNLDLTEPENVKFLHNIFAAMKISDKQIKTALKSIILAPKDRKPNIIFDVTMKDMTKFINIANDILNIGYDKENISIVWVLNTISMALKQNKTRDRMVPEDILLATHDGVSYTMNKILNMGQSLDKYIKGEIYLVFNQANIDNDVKKSKNGGQYIKAQDYILLKARNKTVKKSDIDDRIIQKIKRYVPNSDIWNINL